MGHFQTTLCRDVECFAFKSRPTWNNMDEKANFPLQFETQLVLIGCAKILDFTLHSSKHPADSCLWQRWHQVTLLRFQFLLRTKQMKTFHIDKHISEKMAFHTTSCISVDQDSIHFFQDCCACRWSSTEQQQLKTETLIKNCLVFCRRSLPRPIRKGCDLSPRTYSGF